MVRIPSSKGIAVLTWALLAAMAGFCPRSMEAQAGIGAPASEPADAKARKTFAAAKEWERTGNKVAALDAYRKANKQDGGLCLDCLQHAYSIALSLGEYKDAEAIAREWMPLATAEKDQATVHYLLGIALQRQGLASKKESFFSASSDEFEAALRLDPGLATAHLALGVSRSNLHQDEAARAEFAAFLGQEQQHTLAHERAQRFLDRVDLARAKMAPAFSLVTLDGQQVSMDGLAGKVVLIDFWATWCGPCREALPHIQHVAQEFAGRPFVIMSVSLDKDDSAWKKFVAKNGMTWLQYRDGGFDGEMAKQFGVKAIPSTFTIDADGVLEDQHVGDASFDGKLKKLIAQAEQRSAGKLSAGMGEKAANKGN